MRSFAAVALAALALPASGAASGLPQSAPTERRPSADPSNPYPRWLGWTAMFPAENHLGQVSHEYVKQASLAVDSRGNVHAVNVNHVLNGYHGETTFNGFQQPWHVDYMTDQDAVRAAWGFSEPWSADETFSTFLDDGYGVGVFHPDVWVDPTDQVHVVWIRDYSPYTSSDVKAGELWYRRRTHAGWQNAVNLTPAGLPNRRYTQPRVRAGADGVACVVARSYYSWWDDAAQKTFREDKIVQFTVGSSVSHAIVTPAQWASGGGGDPRLAVDPAGNMHLVWTEEYYQEPTPTTRLYARQCYYSKRTAGAWGGKTALGGALTYGQTFYESPAVAVDSTGAPAMAWVSRAGTSTTLKARVAGGTSTVASSNVGKPGLALDSRGQVHVLWVSAGALYYAARVKNPGPGLSSTWHLQAPAVPAPLSSVAKETSIQAVAISKDDILHVAGDRYYTRSIELGVGRRDPAADVAAFPGASVNAASGNLRYELPLFAAKGKAPSPAMTLGWNALDGAPGFVAPGWAFDFQIRVVDHYLGRTTSSTAIHPDDAITVFFSDGRPVRFKPRDIGGGKFAHVAEDEYGWFGRVERTGSLFRPSHRLILKSGWTYFLAAGRVTNLETPWGERMYFGTTSDLVDGMSVQLPDLIVEANWSRPPVTIAYETRTSGILHPRPIEIRDCAGKRYQLAYSGARLASVKFADGPGAPTYGFEYGTGAHATRLARVLPPRGNAASTKYGWRVHYLPDGRVNRIEDPSEVYLLETEGTSTAPLTRIATMSFSYDETLPPADLRKTTVLDRRNALTVYRLDGRRLLVRELHDDDVLSAKAGIFPTLRAFDAYGNLVSEKDRWGKETTIAYETPPTSTPWVRDNVKEIRRPLPSGAGTELVASLTYSNDGFSNVKTRTTYATPPGGTAPAARTTTYDYDAYGRVISIRHPDVTRPDNALQSNVRTWFQYSGPGGTLSSVTDEEGNSTYYTNFDPYHGLPGRVLRDGGATGEERQYDVMGNLIRHKLPEGGPGSDPTGWTVITLDGLYRRSTLIDPAGKATSFAYDLDSNLTKVTPPAGTVTTSAYDKRGYLKGGTTPDGPWSQWVDADGNVRRSRDLRGFDSHRTYDAQGRVTELRSPGGSTVNTTLAATHVTRMAYDLFDGAAYTSTRTEVAASGNRVTTVTFDNRGRAVKVLRPDNATRVETFYDEQDQAVATQLFHGSAFQSCAIRFLDARDRAFRTRAQNAPFGGTPTHTSDSHVVYNKVGAVVQDVGPLGNVTSSSYAHKTTYIRDARQRVSLVLDGKGVAVQEFRYGDDDLVSEVRVPDPATKSTVLVPFRSMRYTARKEKKAELDAALKGTTFEYGVLPEQVTRVRDALNRATQMTYHAPTQRLHEIVEGAGSTAENRRAHVWTAGLLTEVRVPNPVQAGTTVAYKSFYDKAGRLERREAPLAATEDSVYNEFGELARHVAGTKTIDYAYDRLGRLTAATWSGSHSATQTRTYTGSGALASLTEGNMVQTFSYEAWKGTVLDESFNVSGSAWKVQSYSTDAAGNVVGFSDAEAKLHGWTLDENGRVKTTQYAGKPTTELVYTPGGLVDKEIVKNASGSTIATTTYSYDARGRRMRAQTVRAGRNEVVSDYAWTYDDAGEVVSTELKHLGVAMGAGFDGAGRLVSESTPGNNGGKAAPPFTNTLGALPTGSVSGASQETQATPKATLAVPARTMAYSYDPSGARKSVTVGSETTTYAYNAANQLTSETSPTRTVTHEYDTWGNEVKEITTQGTTSTTRLFGYNHHNRLSSYVSASQGSNWQYQYWPGGDRYAKVNNATNKKDLFVPRGGDVSTEYAQTGTGSVALTNSYVQYPGIDSKAARVSASGQRKHFLSNQVGTLSSVLDDAGAAVETVLRDAWGVLLAGATGERYGFAQREHDSESGLVYMRNRMYNPRTGRFTQTDPIRRNRATRHYAYASNRPSSRVDPFGTQDVSLPPGYTFSNVFEHGGTHYTMRGGTLYKLKTSPDQMPKIGGTGMIDFGANLENLEKAPGFVMTGSAFSAAFFSGASREAMDIAVGVLDAIGFIPVIGEVADAASATIEFATGDDVSGLLTALAIIPGSDAVLKSVKWAWKGARKIAKKGADAAQAAFELLKNKTAQAVTTVLRRVPAEYRGLIVDTFLEIMDFARAVLLGPNDPLVILGRYPAYVDESKKKKARRFDLPSAIWKSLSEEEQWAANARYLDRAIEKGYEFELASDPFTELKGSYKKELRHLDGRGYMVQWDAGRKGWFMKRRR